MRYAFKILSFGWRYLKNYRGRLAVGILCGLLYALLNGGVVWAVGKLQERFSINKKAPAIVSQPQGRVASPGDTVTFTVVATNNFPLRYQWLFNGTNVIGVDADELTLTNIGAAAEGSYSVVVMSISGSRTSSNAVLALSGPAKAVETGAEAKPWLNMNRLQSFGQNFGEKLDPWIPKTGELPQWRQWWFLLVFLPLLFGIRGIVDYLGNYCLGWVGEHAVRDMRLHVMEKLSALSLDFFNRSQTGDLITRINSDTASLLRTLRTAAPDFFKEILSLITVFIVLCSMDWKLTFVAFIVLPLCIIPVVFFGRRARRAMKAARAANVVQTSQLVELIAGIRVIKAYNLEHAELDRFRKSSKEILRADLKGVQAKESVGPIVEVVSIFAVGALLLYILYSPGSVKNLSSFFMAFLFFFQSVKKLSGIHILFEQTHISVDRLMHLLAEPEKVTDPSAPKPFTAFKTAITLENISFGYLEKPVLHDVTLSIPRGFQLGIAGESGSGKTTLVNLLFRFYDPTRGAVKVDGLDLREISMHDLRAQMAFVSQEIVIFNQTVAENIAAGKLDATREEIEAAARAAFAHDFIMQLPRGYETSLGERGVLLSGGQRQRIAIARAFVRNAPILVLDEATASLDSKAEAEVQVAIDHLAEHRTVICVAHRLSTLKAVDKIIVLANGEIVESGTFDELVAKQGVFTSMAARQGFFADA